MKKEKNIMKMNKEKLKQKMIILMDHFFLIPILKNKLIDEFMNIIYILKEDFIYKLKNQIYSYINK
jgi:hypothetical protein